MPNKKNEDILNKNIIDHDIVKEMETSFLDYAMSVIVSRALPDARDGLKPVHRRILYAMSELEMTYGKPYKKSARIVGEVIGKYHPHGDSAVYESLVRMAQDFSLRYPFVQGQGNFGSIDGDSAAAMRYTEARMSAIADLLLKDIKKNTVNYVENYDGTESEPVVLPSKLPTLLINGSTGIAVGMATNIPPHNLGEIIDALVAVANDPEIDAFELLEIVKGPDFPTGATILGDSGIKDAYLSGNGGLMIQSKVEIIRDDNKGSSLIVREIPYMVNKSKLIEKIADLVKNKQIESIRDIRDESNREGIRVVIEFKKGYTPEVELNKLYKMSQLQTSFTINLLAIVENQPKILSLKEALEIYLKHLDIILLRRTKHELKRAEDRTHILEGLNIALSNIDAMIKLIKQSKTTAEATKGLKDKYKLSDKQAKAILDMKLQRLTGLEQNKIRKELDELLKIIADFREIIANSKKRTEVIVKDLKETKEKFGDKRRTKIITGEIKSIDDESLIPEKEVVVTISNSGYVKRIPLETYESQNRGGVGIIGMKTNEKDAVKTLIVTSTHSDLLFFSDIGKVYKIRAHQVPVFGRQAKGIPVINLISVFKGEEIKTMLPMVIYDDEHFLIFTTMNGIIKKTPLSEYKRINRNGKIALGLKKGDNVLSVKKALDTDYILIGSKQGKVIVFKSSEVRSMGRTASGVKGMTVPPGSIIGAAIAKSKQDKILSISEKGFGKLTELEEYRVTGRGGKGVISLNTSKAGLMSALKVVGENDEILLTTNKGTIIRTKISQISQTSRNTKGVIVKKVKDGEKIVSAAILIKDIRELNKDILEETRMLNLQSNKHVEEMNELEVEYKEESDTGSEEN